MTGVASYFTAFRWGSLQIFLKREKEVNSVTWIQIGRKIFLWDCEGIYSLSFRGTERRLDEPTSVSVFVFFPQTWVSRFADWWGKWWTWMAGWCFGGEAIYRCVCPTRVWSSKHTQNLGWGTVRLGLSANPISRCVSAVCCCSVFELWTPHITPSLSSWSFIRELDTLGRKTQSQWDDTNLELSFFLLISFACNSEVLTLSTHK